MKEIHVNEIMIPLNAYATVKDDASLYEAIIALENAQKSYLKSYEPNIYPHRAIIVINKDNKVVGKISQLDILQSLEPRYENLSTSEGIARTSEAGFSREFLQSMVKQYGLYEHSLSYLCQKAAIPGGLLSPLMEGVSYPFFRNLFITPRNLRLYKLKVSDMLAA